MDVPAYDIAEEALKKQLERMHGSVEAGMRIHGSKPFDKACLKIEEVIEDFCSDRAECKE